MEDSEIIKRVMETGEVEVGARSVAKALAGKGAKLLVLSSNCPKGIMGSILAKAKDASVPVYTYAGTSMQLGELCGKPYPISAMAIRGAGDAKIAQLARGAAE